MRPKALIWVLLVALVYVENGCKRKGITSLTDSVAGNYKMHGVGYYSYLYFDSAHSTAEDSTITAATYPDTVITVSAINDSVVSISFTFSTGDNLYSYRPDLTPAYTFSSYSGSQSGSLIFYKSYPDSVRLNLHIQNTIESSYNVILGGRKI